MICESTSTASSAVRSGCYANSVSRPSNADDLSRSSASPAGATIATSPHASSWFWRAWSAAACRIRAALGLCDHDVREVESGRLYYQKDAQPMRAWFSGVYRYCAKTKCDWTKFTGPRIPYRIDREPKGGNDADES